MGIGDFVNKAKDQLSGEKIEQVSDSILDKGAEFISQKTGGKYDDKIQAVRDAADERIGSDGADKVSEPDSQTQDRLDSGQQL
ncbi:MAG: antitoxin [Bowdeniella nasicola]|nr:antitoxin [Bowdeniella nasicola]